MHEFWRKEYIMLKIKIPFLLLLIITMLAFANLISADKPTGPFKVKLEISKLPMLNEEVALICTVTSTENVDSVEVSFWFSDTTMVKVVKGNRKQYTKFKKDETKEFRLVVSFPKEGAFGIVAGATRFFRGFGAEGNKARLYIKTYENKKAVLLESLPWKLPDNVRFPGRPGLRDSIAAWACSLKVKEK
jgi:hypothetical protein